MNDTNPMKEAGMFVSVRSWSCQVHAGATAAVAAFAIASLSACGSGGPSDSNTSGGPEASGGGDTKTPASRQVIDVAAVSDFPPLGYFEGGDTSKIVGANADISDALSKTMGIKFKLHNQTFDSLIPSLQSGRYLIAYGGFTDTKEREAKVWMVDYLHAGANLLIRKEDAASITKFQDLCGKSVAVLKASVYVPFAQSQSKKCSDSGQSPISVKVFPDANTSVLALSSNRVDAVYNSFFITAYTVKSSPDKYASAGPVYQGFPVGIAVAKDHKDLATSLRKGLETLIANGTYKRILDKWNISDAAVTKVKINGARN